MVCNWFKNTYFLLVSLFFFSLISCGQELTVKKEAATKIESGAQQTTLYANSLRNKNIALVANQTSVLLNKEGNFEHLVDSLVALNFNIVKVFSPEHGFRGNADAGEKVNDGIDLKTGLPLISLYGNNKKPTEEQLLGVDVVVFDIQDVGVRFYTYISTLHYVMEACGEAGIELIVLDRPNPNAHYIDGPVLEKEYTSFVGMHPVPIVYGMTIGEYAQMINGEGWLKNKIQCELTVIPLKNYTHSKPYSLPIKPSPNLPNEKSINLYPSLCFFEGTNVSAGRGTEKQFQIFGSPFLSGKEYNFCFTPEPNEGSKYPKHNGVKCCGRDLSNVNYLSKIDISYLIKAYRATSDQKVFFNSFFPKLAGTNKLQRQIENSVSIEDIYNSWKNGIQDFKKVRNTYLIYQ